MRRMRRMRCPRSHHAAVTLLIGVFIGGCSGSPPQPADAPTFTFDFNRGAQGFIAGFADYPPAHAESYELTSGYRVLPIPIGAAVRAVHLRSQPE